MDVPPYSPTAASSERRLPSDYWPARRCEDEDPLDSLIRRRDRSMAQTPTSPRSLHFRPVSEVSSSSASSYADNTLQPVATAPATTTEFSSESPFAFGELPPEYAPIDDFARSFRLDAPFVYTTKTSNLPRYQLMQEFTRSGRPRKLSIRRLMPAESRSHSLPTSSLAYGPLIRYDEESTMYSMACYDLPGSVFNLKNVEMRGHRSSTLSSGKIKLESGKSFIGGRSTRIWYLTKNARRDSLNPENEARMQKYGYHAGDEWDKRLLFCVKKGIWEDGEGREVARETEGEFEVCERAGREGWRRDLAVSCWVMKVWTGEGLRWENDVKGW